MVRLIVQFDDYPTLVGRWKQAESPEAEANSFIQGLADAHPYMALRTDTGVTVFRCADVRRVEVEKD